MEKHCYQLLGESILSQYPKFCKSAGFPAVSCHTIPCFFPRWVDSSDSCLLRLAWASGKHPAPRRHFGDCSVGFVAPSQTKKGRKWENSVGLSFSQTTQARNREYAGASDLSNGPKWLNTCKNKVRWSIAKATRVVPIT